MTLVAALGYLRTSSATNVGEDKDSDRRQRATIEAGARRMGYEIIEWFYDAPETAAKNAALVTTAKGLAPGRTLLAISAALAEQGYVTRHGKAFSASQVKRLIR